MPWQQKLMSNGNKNAIFVEADVINNLQSFGCIPLMASEEMIFEYFFLKFKILVVMATNQMHRVGQKWYVL